MSSGLYRFVVQKAAPRGSGGLRLRGRVGDGDTTAIEDLSGAGFCKGSGVRYGVRM